MWTSSYSLATGTGLDLEKEEKLGQDLLGEGPPAQHAREGVAKKGPDCLREKIALTETHKTSDHYQKREKAKVHKGRKEGM